MKKGEQKIDEKKGNKNIKLLGASSLFNDIGTSLTLSGKENKIKDYKKENVELAKRIHQLELENTRLKAETNTADDDKSL